MRPDSLEEGLRWFRQAKRDLDDAQYNYDGGRFNLSCFLSQQAAEKALKAYLYSLGEELVLGHSVAKLLKEASNHDPTYRELRKVSGLDKYYVPTRYPNGLPGGVPYEAFDEVDASRAMELASELIGYIEKVLIKDLK
ncbi:MAG: HEPN domain-containing protein [Methanotrichaceae archaeon]|nr:HEPN domain-containing protein [Methanotrichaceae archaeon]